MRNACSTDSVWSIDIAYLLRYFRLSSTFFTVIRGVRPEYRKQEFYRKQISEDTRRVNQLFESADRESVHVVQRPVLLSEIQRAVSEDNNLVLVLLDKRLLKCAFCDCSPVQTRSFFSNRSTPGFLGHYVLLYAHHPASDKFLMKDPAAPCETCVISSDTLEEARLAFGTDQDIIFIRDCEDDGDSPNLLLTKTAS